MKFYSGISPLKMGKTTFLYLLLKTGPIGIALYLEHSKL